MACMGKNRHAQKTVVRNNEGKRLLGRPKCKWNDNIKIGVKSMMEGSKPYTGSG